MIEDEESTEIIAVQNNMNSFNAQLQISDNGKKAKVQSFFVDMTSLKKGAYNEMGENWLLKNIIFIKGLKDYDSTNNAKDCLGYKKFIEHIYEQDSGNLVELKSFDTIDNDIKKVIQDKSNVYFFMEEESNRNPEKSLAHKY